MNLMAGHPLAASILVICGALGSAAIAQEVSADGSVRPLTSTVLPLRAVIENLGGEATDISSQVRDKLAQSEDIAIGERGNDLVLSVASDLLFDFDSAELSAQAKETLGRLSEVLAGSEIPQITVVGHTDSKGDDDYNLELSQRRAKAVAAFLEKRDIPANRMRVEGRGETEPVANNSINGQDNPDGRAKNRRVEFIIPGSD